jgi:hypothetical protein
MAAQLSTVQTSDFGDSRWPLRNAAPRLFAAATLQFVDDPPPFRWFHPLQVDRLSLDNLNRNLIFNLLVI